jgi:acetylornithine deacetylase/succinyl-diaminopimelate desuccinylase-like protein
LHREIRVRIVIRFLSLLVAVAAAAVPGARAGGMEAAIPLPPPGDRSAARAIFKELIEINTTHAHGSTEAAKAIESHLLAAGFAADDVHVLAPPDHPSKSSVVLRYHGKSAGRAVLFLGHLDVVDARPEDWSVDPFRLTEKDGWFYGRGTIDMKNGDAALLAALIRLKRGHFVPARDVIVAFTADEEAGGDANGPAFLLKNHRELIEAETAINLDGGQGNYKNGKPFYYEFGTSEKTYVTFTLEATSAGGHGSLPGPDNAIYRLAAGLGRLSAYKFPVMLTATTRTSFKMMADIDPGPDSADMRAVAKQPPDSAAAERLSQNVRFNAELRTTCVATLIAGGHAENALPQRARATVQCRMMPGDSGAHVQSTLVSVLNDGKIGVTMDATPIESPESPPTEAITRKISNLVHSMWPGVPVIPTMATGYSDDRQLRSAGIASYDVSGVWMDVDENRAHGRDERIGIQEFDASVEFTYRLIKSMSQAD